MAAKGPLATIEMENGGVIKIELDPGNAPNTVNNFIAQANDGFYDGLTFHRVIPGFMVQGGCPHGSGTGGPGYSIKGEFSANGVKNKLSHKRGVLSMARSQANDSAGCQFFITVKTATHLNGQYAAFGTVTEGMNVVDELANVPRDYQDKPIDVQQIKTIRVDTFGIDYDSPVKV